MKALFRSALCPSVLLLSVLASSVPAAAQASSAPSRPTTFVFFQRTGSHVRLSIPEVFQQIVDEMQEYLKTNHVDVMTGANSPSSDTGLEVPLPAVQEMARDSKAPYLLYVVVDRPITNWLKVTARCFDASGREIWREESASNRSVFHQLNSWPAAKEGTHALVVHLQEQLNKHLGQPGFARANIERAPAVTATAENQFLPAEKVETLPETIRIASGTPVSLLVTETISSRTATSGTPLKLQVFGDVKVNGLVVIANKAVASGTLAQAEAAGRAWHAGKLVLKLNTVTFVNEQQQRLRAWSAVRGRDTNAGIEWANAVTGTYGLALLALPFAPLQHGNQAFLYRGTLLEAAIDGDVLLPLSAVEAAQPKRAEPLHGPASVTFYYQDVGKGYAVDIWCGQVKVGHLRRGGKFTMSLPVGKYSLRLADRGHPTVTVLEAQEGGELYVSVNVSPHQRTATEVSWRPSLSVVPHDIGEAQAEDTNLLKSEHVKDVAKLDLTQLQAEPQSKAMKKK